ncbi:MAG: nitronate monooxygenase [Prevotella sp.]|jgi:enoyl-[acyl-carrier protein] reductase II|nr:MULTISPECIES: nitronate monooxygenase [unclassified Prevotella]MCH3970421.1 nitronate monooxygenase [Prevotella sp.]MCH3991066.1 nitronate monooxygenase [Prevotella sp.]MCH4018205.1 nitronate monooxygenase [Prevotella sp.]MCH4100523.1 nitronate monooxygenase [Prevotella sp.]MCH4186855.1 nitronate monooxygenase [Prevotella sp.]
MKNNRISQLFDIKYPIIQGGMAWCSGWRLASAVSNAGGLGLLGASTMHPDVLREHIREMNAATHRPWGVNIPLRYPEMETLVQLIIDEGVKIVFTSAGSPKTYTQRFHDAGIKVAHVVSSSIFAKKCEAAGVDAIVAEGFEAGGHNGREETTTLTLIPQIREVTNLPLIAAGGIASGRALLAMEALGADGVQIGTRFALSQESSASTAFKEKCLSLSEGDTMLCLKKIAPTRLVKNALFRRVAEAEDKGAGAEELRTILGEKASKKGIFEGDIENGELEIGQVSSSLHSIETVNEIMDQLLSEYHQAKSRICTHPMIG